MTNYVWTIIGSGFGLYGYLPAIMGIENAKVILPQRTASKLLGRSELSHFYPSIQWTTEDDDALGKANSVAISVPPQQQYLFIKKVSDYKNIKNLILEKPIATTPSQSLEILDLLHEQRKNYLTNYSFWYTKWSDDFNSSQSSSFDKVTIDWSFMAHHFRHDKVVWKRYHSQGGGPIRFYGIHLIALLAKIGYTEVASSSVFPPASDSAAKWSAVFSGKGVPDCQVCVDSCCDRNEFHIAGYLGDENYDLINCEQPFAQESFPGQDARASIIYSVVSQLLTNDNTQLENIYKNVIYLWEKVEKIAFKPSG